jgi:hypothetical protein
MLIRMKTNYAQPAVQICADVHFSVLIRTGVILPPPAAAAAVRPFYSNFDWLDYGLILLVN